MTSKRAKAADVAAFMRVLWGDDGMPAGEGRFALFVLPDSRSSTHTSIDAAAKEAAKLSTSGSEVYLRISALRPDFPSSSTKRGTDDDSVFLPALAVDLDLQLPDRKKRKLFATVDEAQDLLDRLPLRPTMVVASGGGLQAWWVFKEPLDLREEGARDRARAASRGWHETVMSAAVEIGRTIDSMWDLSRVMRIPGTFNRKREEPHLVEIVDGPHALLRYTIDDVLDRSLDETQWGGKLAGASTVDGLKLRPTASPPTERFDALMEFDPKFKSSWNHRRRDLQDDSLSGYDMSLASIAVRAGWEDQEICDLLIAHRRKYGGELKLRERYYSGTIENARRGVEVTAIASEIVASGGASPEDDSARDKILKLFSSICGASIVRVIVYEPEGVELTFKFADDRQFHLGQSDFADWFRFWKRLVAAGFSPRPERPKQSVWLSLVASVYNIADRERVESSGDAARVAALCVGLARDSGVRFGSSGKAHEATSPELRASAIRNNGAFLWDGLLWVRLSGLARIATEKRVDRDLSSTARLRAVLVEDLQAIRRTHNVTVKPKGGDDHEASQVGGTVYGILQDRLREAIDETETNGGSDDDKHEQ